MSRFLRKEKARVCPIHNAVYDAAAARLGHDGVFSKEEIIEALRFDAVADAIRWDYIREFLEHDQGCSLTPLAAAYFKRHKREAEILNTSRYIAVGHGKKTAGYAAVTPANDHLVVAQVIIRKRMLNGAGEAFANYLQAIAAKRGSDPLTSTQRPALPPVTVPSP